MALITNIIGVNQTGDIGGLGISRFACTNASGAALAPSEANSWAAAVMNIYTALRTLFPNNMTFTLNPIIQNIETDTSGLLGEQTVGTVPPPVTGSVSFDYVAGTGARAYWVTSTVINRRLVRGATYLTPMTASAFAANGAVASGTQTAVLSMGVAYLAAMTTAGLTPVVYHRATRTAPNTGQSATIIGIRCSTIPCSVRSRRS